MYSLVCLYELHVPLIVLMTAALTDVGLPTAGATAPTATHQELPLDLGQPWTLLSHVERNRLYKAWLGHFEALAQKGWLKYSAKSLGQEPLLRFAEQKGLHTSVEGTKHWVCMRPTVVTNLTLYYNVFLSKDTE
ncbi:hypothetical protein WISP_145133 [Willisornis vidua]|uniref:Uncharacterized protein n=1 Tax=Willisornis vidua TaxID=1566151 RepID=A0ABQ9CL10_9PASS|nr:hypothetical protein WISP_145133 [Willisornis vidua]